MDVIKSSTILWKQLEIFQRDDHVWLEDNKFLASFKARALSMFTTFTDSGKNWKYLDLDHLSKIKNKLQNFR